MKHKFLNAFSWAAGGVAVISGAIALHGAALFIIAFPFLWLAFCPDYPGWLGLLLWPLVATLVGGIAKFLIDGL